MRRSQADQIADQMAKAWRSRLYKVKVVPGMNPRAQPQPGWVIQAWDVDDERWVTFVMAREWERWKIEHR